MVRTLLFEQEDETEERRHLESKTTEERLGDLYVLAVTDQQIHSYSIGDKMKMWSYDLTAPANEHFAFSLWVCFIKFYFDKHFSLVFNLY